MREIAGIEVIMDLEELVAPRHTALVIVDAQNDGCADGGVAAQRGKELALIKAAVPRVAETLAAARRAGVLPVYVKNVWLPDGSSLSGPWMRFMALRNPVEVSQGWHVAGTWGAEVISPIAPEPGDLIVVKHRSSAFFNTPLDTLLRCNGVKTVVCVGFVTEGCLDSTVRDAMFRDYYAVVLEDCVGTYDRELHEAAMRVLRARTDVMASQEVIQIWRRHGDRDRHARRAGAATGAGA
jgi:nicotinamidase-related amidase